MSAEIAGQKSTELADPSLLSYKTLALLTGTACFYVLPALASDFTGKVVGVSDGDTIKVMHNKRAEKIRLYGIDCPEMKQAFGTRAKLAASELAFGQTVTVISHAHDRYGRTIGEVILPNGRNLNHELVGQGMCWWYRKYAPNSSVLERLEVEARSEKRGLWLDPSPVPPWQWRHNDR